MAYDTVCGMYVDERTTLTSLKDGRKYYFCSTKCRLQFEKPEKELHELKLALIVAWPLAIIVALITYFFPHVSFAGYTMLALATIVQFYSGLRFYAGTIDAIKNRSSNMDTLIAIGTTAAWGYSSFLVLFPQAFPASGLYFDTSTIIIALILTGTYMQRLAESRAAIAIEGLVKLQPKVAHLVNKNAIMDVPIENIKVGDIILVKPGERIPIDGVVVEGRSSVDESMITGESMPVSKKTDDKVIGGTMNSSGSLRIKAQKVGSDSTLSQIIRIVNDAASSRVPIQRLVDTISSYFVPAVIAIAFASALLWYFVWHVSASYAILAFVSVLIIACPCALGIATPAALMVSSGVSARSGILVKNGEALELASKIDTIVLDKTGTLTKGRPEVTDILPFSGFKQIEVLSNAATAERNSEHVIGKAIVSNAEKRGIKPEFPRSFNYREGSGINATSKKGTRITMGNRDLFGKLPRNTESRMQDFENDGKTALIVGLNGKIAGIIAIADVLKEDSKAAVDSFKRNGIEVWMITGDNQRTAKAMAKKLGIKNLIAEAKPKTKLKEIEKLQKEGRIVAMVGDGVNDAPALAKANVGIALGAGTDVAIETGGIILVKNKVLDVVKAIEISRTTMRKIRQNLFWAFGYNTILIPVAAGALVPVFGISIYDTLPILAAFAMAFSSVTVVANSLLLSKTKV